ncbi:MAG: (2Fe-2S)-binding protein [Pyrinomonadaceae bacterium]
MRLRTADLDQIGDIANAGTGCGSCRMLIRELIDVARFD